MQSFRSYIHCKAPKFAPTLYRRETALLALKTYDLCKKHVHGNVRFLFPLLRTIHFLLSAITQTLPATKRLKREKPKMTAKTK